MRLRIIAILFVVSLAAQSAQAQLLVSDPLLTVKAVLTHTYTDLIVMVKVETNALLKRMGRRLSFFTGPLRHYIAQNAPLYRTWRQDNPSPEALVFMNALNGGVGPSDLQSVAPSRVLDPEFDIPVPVKPSLAMLDLQDSAIVAGIDQTGRLRGLRRSEREAIAALESAVQDTEGSLTARLGVLSAASMITARQKQARMGLVGEIGTQLLVGTILDRQDAVAEMELRLAAMKPAKGGGVFTGAGDALRHSWLP